MGLLFSLRAALHARALALACRPTLSGQMSEEAKRYTELFHSNLSVFVDCIWYFVTVFVCDQMAAQTKCLRHSSLTAMQTGQGIRCFGW